jgi:hypothetical protein
MSIRIRIPTANIPANLAVIDSSILQLRRSERKTRRTLAIAVLAAAALAANIADAAASNHHRHSGVSAPKSSWVGRYAPSDYGGVPRADHEVASWACVRPSDGAGAYPDILVEMVYHRYDAC